jgi:hypothetical protein
MDWESFEINYLAYEEGVRQDKHNQKVSEQKMNQKRGRFR